MRTLGDVKRSGAWVVPAESRYRSWLGHIKLDLRDARISEPEVHIHAWALFGTIDLLVPEGVEVDVQARAKLGQLKQEAGGVATPGAPRIVLTGGTVFGEIKVRHRRLWEKLGARARTPWKARAGRPAPAPLRRSWPATIASVQPLKRMSSTSRHGAAGGAP